MFEALLLPGVSGGQVGIGSRPVPAFYRGPSIDSRPPLAIGGVGTGGSTNPKFFIFRKGYQQFVLINVVAPSADAPFAQLMSDVKAGFGRTMSRLPEVFGVSRQTLYNWLDGETPKPMHQAKLKELAKSAIVFSELGFKPTSLSLDRTVSNGKSLLQLLSEGADGREAAVKLVRIARRGAVSLSRLDGLLGDRKSRPDVTDMGTPSFNERA